MTAAPGQGMRRAHHRDHAFAKQRIKAEAGHVVRCGQAAHHQIQRPASELFQQQIVVAGADGEPRPKPAGAELGHRVGDQPGRHRRQRAQIDPWAGTRIG